MLTFLSSPLVVKRDIVVSILLCISIVYVRACERACVRPYLSEPSSSFMHGFQNYSI